MKKVFHDFITVDLQDMMGNFPNILTAKSFFFTEYQSLHFRTELFFLRTS